MLCVCVCVAYRRVPIDMVQRRCGKYPNHQPAVVNHANSQLGEGIPAQRRIGASLSLPLRSPGEARQRDKCTCAGTKKIGLLACLSANEAAGFAGRGREEGGGGWPCCLPPIWSKFGLSLAFKSDQFHKVCNHTIPPTARQRMLRSTSRGWR